MLARSDFSHLAQVCETIGNDVSDTAGFVSIRNLLTRFNARLLIRPLLVEGMLASVADTTRTPGLNSDASCWAVLIDSETYQLGDDALEAESPQSPLPSRLRNTIAKETERLSPLLLWSKKALAKLLNEKKEPFSVDELRYVAQRTGISRYVLINRLRMLDVSDRFRDLPRLKNIAIGLAKWNDFGSALLTWPLFANFDRNVVPTFCLKLIHQNGLLAQEFCSDESFAMCGGLRNSAELLTDAGTIQTPNLTKMKIRISAENCEKKAGTEFIYVVHKQPS